MDDQLARGQQLELRPASRPIDQNSTDKKPTVLVHIARCWDLPQYLDERPDFIEKSIVRGFRVRTAALTQRLLVPHSNFKQILRKANGEIPLFTVLW